MRHSPAIAAVVLALALGTAACGASDDGAAATTTTTSTTEAPPLTGTTQPPTLAQQKMVIAFAPVLSVASCEITDAPISTDTTVPVAGSDLTQDAEGELCYRLGPTTGDGNDLVEAEVTDVGLPEPAVSVRVRPASVDRLNHLFDGCYAGAPTCPPAGPDGRGAVAIVYEGAVVSAPTVQGSQLASDAFTITGEFTEAEAADLAELLNRTG